MNDKHHAVEQWLDKILAGQPIPGYELNDTTLNILSALMERNQLQDSATEVIRDDLLQKAEEYKAEADRLNQVLSRLGLTPDGLSQSGTVGLKSLVSISLLLNLKTASTTNLFLALSDMTQDKLLLADTLRLERRLSARVAEKTDQQLQQLALFKLALQDVEAVSKSQDGVLIKKSKEAIFLQDKARDYRKTIEQRKKELTATGVNPSIYHSTLLIKSQELQVQRSRLQDIKSKLDAYHTLPPDISLAKVKVEESKRELAALEVELAQHIDLMHI